MASSLLWGEALIRIMQKLHTQILLCLLLLIVLSFGCSDMPGHSFSAVNGVVNGTVKDQKIEDFLPALIEMLNDALFEDYDWVIRSDKEEKYSFSFNQLKTKGDLLFLIESKLKLSVKDLEEHRIIIIANTTNSINQSSFLPSFHSSGCPVIAGFK